MSLKQMLSVCVSVALAWHNGNPANVVHSSYRGSQTFIGNNEPFGELYHNIASLKQVAGGFGGSIARMISPVGSFMAPLTLASYLDFAPDSDIIFFDANPDSIRLGELLIALVRVSDGPSDFISKLYSRNVKAFERLFGPMTAKNQNQFFNLEPQPEIWADTLAQLTQEQQDTYSVMVRQSGLWTLQNRTCGNPGTNNCVLPAHDSTWPALFQDPVHLGSRSGKYIFKKRDFPNGTINYAAWMYGLGWLTDQSSFDSVKKRLPRMKFVKAFLDDAVRQFMLCRRGTNQITVLYTMDMGVNNYVKGIKHGKIPTNIMEAYACDVQLAWIQSMTCEKKDLCTMRLTGHTPTSCADWDSSFAPVGSTTAGQVAASLTTFTAKPAPAVASCGRPSLEGQR